MLSASNLDGVLLRIATTKKYEDANEFVIRRLVCEEDVIANKFFPLMLA